MKIRFIEESKQDNILLETENTEGLSAIFNEFTQIQITKPNEVLHCKYVYNVLKVVENEIDVFVEIDDTTDVKSYSSQEAKDFIFN